MQKQTLKQTSKNANKSQLSAIYKCSKSGHFGMSYPKKQQQNVKIQKEDSNQMKKMNDLIRKKNSLLLKKK